MNRRFFLMGAAAAAARATAPASANDTVRVACVGTGPQGKMHIQAYSRMAGVEIAALCDVDESRLNECLRIVENLGRKRPAAFTDFRKLLEDRSIDAVSIATPDHHHTLQTILACQAGKDVYVEKPCSHSMFEARQVAAAAARYKRVVEHGTDSRSIPAIREAVRQLGAGAIGDVYSARGLCFKPRNTIGHRPAEPVPPGVDYDLWLGPAPAREFTRNRFHYTWHWFWDYGSGDIGNQGIHQLDVARWGLGVRYPVRVSAMGGHFMFDDDQETPNTLAALFEFNEGGREKMLEFSVRHWLTNHEAGIGGAGKLTIGNIFYGSNGYLVIDDYDRIAVSTYLGPDGTPGPASGDAGAERGDHWADFIACVRSRRHDALHAPIEEGAISTILVHLANISYRLGRSVKFDAETYTCPGDREATAMFTHPYRRPFELPALA